SAQRLRPNVEAQRVATMQTATSQASVQDGDLNPITAVGAQDVYLDDSAAADDRAAGGVADGSPSQHALHGIAIGGAGEETVILVEPVADAEAMEVGAILPDDLPRLIKPLAAGVVEVVLA